MAAITEEDLQKKEDANAKLREQIADQQRAAAERTQQSSAEVRAAQLDTENARLTAQLAAAKEQAKPAVAKAGAEGPLSAAKEQLEAAQAGVTPPGVTVDTNASKSDSSSTASDKPADKNKE